MAIKYVKVKRTITVGKNPGDKYLARLFRGQDVRIDQIASDIAGSTTVSYPDVLACLKAMEIHVSKYVLAGQAVKFGLLGSFIPAISAKAVDTPEAVTLETIRYTRCRFYPSAIFMQSLAKSKYELADLEIKGLHK